MKKDKLFLFGNYEGFRQRLGISNVAVVPDAQARSGLFARHGVRNSDEFGARRCCRFPMPSGRRRMGRSWGRVATAPLSLKSRQAIREDFGLVRFDYNVSAKDSFSANYLIDDGENDLPQRTPSLSTRSPAQPVARLAGNAYLLIHRSECRQPWVQPRARVRDTLPSTDPRKPVCLLPELFPASSPLEADADAQACVPSASGRLRPRCEYQKSLHLGRRCALDQRQPFLERGRVDPARSANHQGVSSGRLGTGITYPTLTGISPGFSDTSFRRPRIQLRLATARRKRPGTFRMKSSSNRISPCAWD